MPLKVKVSVTSGIEKLKKVQKKCEFIFITDIDANNKALPRQCFICVRES